MQQFIDARGKKLFVETVGPQDAPALLFLHGGPGGTGSLDFPLFAGRELQSEFRLVMFDQRGVMRSEALLPEDTVSLDDLVADCEVVREALEIREWSVLGHSFGGYVAVVYALKHPEVVRALVLETPTFGWEMSEHGLIRGLAEILPALGETELAEKGLRLVEEKRPRQEVYPVMMQMFERAGVQANALFHRPGFEFIPKLAADLSITADMWRQTEIAREKTLADRQVYESLLPALQDVKIPALLICGQYDWITTDEQIRAFQQSVIHGRTVMFSESAHYPRVEETERYIRVVSEFLKSSVTEKRSPAK